MLWICSNICFICTWTVVGFLLVKIECNCYCYVKTTDLLFLNLYTIMISNTFSFMLIISHFTWRCRVSFWGLGVTYVRHNVSPSSLAYTLPDTFLSECNPPDNFLGTWCDSLQRYTLKYKNCYKLGRWTPRDLRHIDMNVWNISYI